MSHPNPIIVTVSGETVDEIRSKLLQLAKDFGHDDRQETLPLSPSATTAGPAPEKPRRGRPPIAEKSTSAPEKQSAPPIEEKATESTATSATATATASKEQVVAALQQLQSAINLKAVIEVLGKFDAKKASEVKEIDYAAVVAECNRQVSQAATLTA